MKLWALLFVGAMLAEAGETCQFKSIEEFKKKLLSPNPVTEEIELKKERASVMTELAKQRPNPTVELEYERDDQFGVEANTYRVKALHTVELGGKRNARINRASAEKKMIEQELELSKASFLVDALIDYRRAQQLDLQISALKEAIKTYKDIIQKLSRRKRLTPEERVSLSTLRLALGDFEGRLHELVHEMETLVVKISYWASCARPSFDYTVFKYQKLPEYNLDPKKGLASLALKDLEIAKKEFEEQNSLGFSNLAVGPILAYQEQGSEDAFSAGIGVTFNAPVFHTNTGGKALAAKKVNEKELGARNQVKLARLKLNKELHVYEHSLNALKKMPDPKVVSKQHHEAEKLFRRGVVSIPMVIESHRQHIEYLGAWFEIENDILNSLKEIYLLTERQEILKKIFE